MALRHRQLNYGYPVPQDWFDAIQDYIGPAMLNLRLEILNPTTLIIPGSDPWDQAAVGIMGRWRWVTANVTAAHPGGPPGQYDVFVTATDNDFVLGGPHGEIDQTNYSFGMIIRAQGQVPTTPLYRKIAECTWNGILITAITMTQGTTAIGVAYPINRGEVMMLGGLV